MTATATTGSTWWVEVFLGESDGVSTATAVLHTRDRSRLSTRATARLEPHAADGPEIGYEIATARALSALAASCSRLRRRTSRACPARRAPVRVPSAEQQLGEQLDVLLQVPVADVLVEDACVCGAAQPGRQRRVAEHEPQRPREGAPSRGSSRSKPSRPWTIWSWIPPTRLAITGRPFHIASVTVSPNPSTRLFCTTTSACRCSALTISAFSSMSSMGIDGQVDAGADRPRAAAATAPGTRPAPGRPPGRRSTPATSGRPASGGRRRRVSLHSGRSRA